MSLLPELAAADADAAWSINGQRDAATVLRRAVVRSEVGHAWAFVGPAGVGQETAARVLAAALNCPVARAPDVAPCGTCETCDRCRRGAYPAYWEFAPTGAQHRVDEVRGQWLRTAALTTTEGRVKVLRIIDADRMNEPAANAFLKALEEPPPGTVWILDLADPDELPDTVLSRCRVLRFRTWGEAELAAEAERLGLAPGADRDLAVRAALGSPATLARLATPCVRDKEGKVRAPSGLDDLRDHREIIRRLRADGPRHALVAARALDDEVKRRTAELKQHGRKEVSAIARLYGDAAPRGILKQVEERAARKERGARTAVAQAALDDLLGWLRDCLLVAGGGDATVHALHRDDAAGLADDAAALGATRLLTAVDLVLATRDSLELNVQQGLALEALLLELSAVVLAPAG